MSSIHGPALRTLSMAYTAADGDLSIPQAATLLLASLMLVAAWTTIGIFKGMQEEEDDSA